MKKFGYISLFGYLLFSFVMLSTSICVFESGTYCEDSSVLLVSHSDVKENNGYSILVEQLCILDEKFNCERCCTDSYLRPVVVAKTQKTDLNSRMINNELAEIFIPPDIGSGMHTIFLEFCYSILIHCGNFGPNCTLMAMCNIGSESQCAYLLNHTITLKVIDNPIFHQSENSEILQCQLNDQFSDAWSEFVLNDTVLGYCGKFAHAMKDEKRGISIYYDSSDDVCSLKIDMLTEDNEGNYLCNVMVPYPDGRGYLRLNSTSITLHQDSNTSTNSNTSSNTRSSNAKAIIIAVGASVGNISLIIIAIVVCTCVCRWYWLKAQGVKQPLLNNHE